MSCWGVLFLGKGIIILLFWGFLGWFGRGGRGVFGVVFGGWRGVYWLEGIVYCSGVDGGGGYYIGVVVGGLGYGGIRKVGI